MKQKKEEMIKVNEDATTYPHASLSMEDDVVFHRFPNNIICPSQTQEKNFGAVFQS